MYTGLAVFTKQDILSQLVQNEGFHHFWYKSDVIRYHSQPAEPQVRLNKIRLTRPNYVFIICDLFSSLLLFIHSII